MCSSEGQQAVPTEEEGTTEMDTPSFAPDRTSQPSHLSDSSSSATHSSMPAGHTEILPFELQSPLVVGGPSKRITSVSDQPGSSLSTGNTQISSESSPLQTALISNLPKSEIATLKSSSTSTESEATSLKSRISSLEASNRDTFTLLESKSTAYDGLTEDSFSSLRDSSIDSWIHSTTTRTATILNRPSSQEEIKILINTIKKQFDSDRPPASQYLLVKDIPHKLFETLAKDEETITGVRILTISRERTILYKIIPSKWYEFITQKFSKWLDLTLEGMGLSSVTDHFTWGGSASHTNGQYIKEPDSCFFIGTPSATGGPVVWPSLVIETGKSESLGQLRTDAQWWYANSNGRTKIVVLISAEFDLRDVVFEIWTEVENQSEQMTRGRATNVLRCTQTARYTNGVGSGLPLHIPFRLLMGRPKGNQEEDPELTLQWVVWICP